MDKYGNQGVPVIDTERLRLRKLNIDDVESIYNIFSSEDIMKYYGIYPLKDRESAKNLIIRFNDASIGNAFRWGIELKGENQLIGTCGFHNWNKLHKRAEIGYELHHAYWKRGYINEAVQSIIEFGFNELELYRIEALVYPENIPSQRSLERLGFEREGLLRGYAYFRDKYQDLMMYSLLRAD